MERLPTLLSVKHSSSWRARTHSPALSCGAWGLICSTPPSPSPQSRQGKGSFSSGGQEHSKRPPPAKPSLAVLLWPYGLTSEFSAAALLTLMESRSRTSHPCSLAALQPTTDSAFRTRLTKSLPESRNYRNPFLSHEAIWPVAERESTSWDLQTPASQQLWVCVCVCSGRLGVPPGPQVGCQEEDCTVWPREGDRAGSPRGKEKNKSKVVGFQSK